MPAAIAAAGTMAEHVRTPKELANNLAFFQVDLSDAGLKCVDVEGIAWSPTRGLHRSDDVRLNYLVAAVAG